MPYREENADAFVSDVFGRVMISIMPRAAIGTSPKTIRKRKLLIAMTTARTQLRRWKPTINQDKVSVAPSGFVFDLSKGLTMRGVADRFGKLGSRHAFEVQRFARNRAVLFDDRSGELMSEVSPTVSNLLVFTSQRATGFGPVCATFLATGKAARGALDLAFDLPEKSGIFDNAAIRVGGKSLKSHVDTDCRFRFNRRLWQIGQVEFNDQRDMPLAGGLALECRALQGQITGLRLSDSDPTNFRNVDAAIFEFGSLRDAERLTRVVFPLEPGKACPFLKEVVKRVLAIGEGLLQELRILRRQSRRNNSSSTCSASGEDARILFSGYATYSPSIEIHLPAGSGGLSLASL